MDPSEQSNDLPALTIGAVAQATGIGASTLRAWERRYGFPSPTRTEGGHRLYAPESVERIRWIARALARGLRPRQVVPMPLEGLKRTLSTACTVPIRREEGAASYVQAWLDAARHLDGEALELSFRTETAHLGALAFLTDRVAPFLHEMGAAWERGELEVYQEHFATARLRGWLDCLWRPLADHNRGPVSVAATPPGEQHCLGLEMAVTALILAGWRPIYLGASTPAIDILAAARQIGARAVVLSISAHAPRGTTRSFVDEMVGCASDAALVIGGQGAPRGVPGTTWLPDCGALAEWGRDNA